MDTLNWDSLTPEDKAEYLEAVGLPLTLVDVKWFRMNTETRDKLKDHAAFLYLEVTA